MTPQRLFDLSVGAALLGVTWPLAATAGVAIRVVDQQPALFTQPRVGLERAPFIVLKLRTMRDGTPTPLGRLLRKTRIDELPQLVNVLRGDMSLVGPRPLTEADVIRLGWDTPASDLRWRIRPGITGPTQLSPICDATRALTRDCRYAVVRTVASDATILAATLLRPVVGGRAVAWTARWK